MVWKRQFDEDELLQRVMETFWRFGYHATSIGRLVEATGVNRASLYGAYRDKNGLLIAALDRYSQQLGPSLLSRVPEGANTRQTIHALFRGVLDGVIEDGGDGCFYVNVAMELAPHDATLRSTLHTGFVSVEKLFASYLAKGVASGEFAHDLQVEDVAAEFLTLFLGLQVLSRTEPDPLKVERIGRRLDRILDGG